MSGIIGSNDIPNDAASTSIAPPNLGVEDDYAYPTLVDVAGPERARQLELHRVGFPFQL
jgi:hypothetical protein